MNINSIFRSIIYLSILGSVMSCIIFFIKFIFKNKFNSTWHYYIWMLLIIRLILPFNPPSVMSIYNLSKGINTYSNNKIEQKTDINSVTDLKVNAPDSKDETELQNKVYDLNSAKSSNMFLDSSKVIPYIWISGMVAILIYMFIIDILFRRSIKKQCLCDDYKINYLLEYCCREMKIKKKINVFYSKSIKSPAITGIINTKILIPQGTLEKLNDNEIKYVIMHELSHYKRKDILMNWIIIILQSVYWFNPFIIFSLNCMRKDIEMACDASVMNRLKLNENIEYGNAIIHFAKIFSEKYYVPARSSIVSNNNIKRRISMISKFKKNSLRMTIIAIVVIIIAGCAGLTGVNAAKKNNTLASKQQEKTANTIAPANDKQNDIKQSNENKDTNQNTKSNNTVNPVSENPQDVLSKLTGEWFQKDYIDALIKTKSPFKSQNQVNKGNVVLRILKDNGSYNVMRGFSFHQAMNDRISSITKLNNNVYEIKFLTDSNKNETATVTIYSDGNDVNRIVYSDSYSKNVEMIKESNIASLVINGRYTDDKGKVYTFKNDGVYWNSSNTAVWPDKTFRYCINFDTAMTNCDYIYEVGSNGLTAKKYYIYEWQGSTLRIYNAKVANNGEEIVKDGSSFILLHPVK